MGQITEVIYQQIDESLYDKDNFDNYYYYLNMLGNNMELNERYENIEYNQIKLKQSLLSKIKDRKIIASTSFLGVSNLNGKAVIISEIEKGCECNGS